MKKPKRKLNLPRVRTPRPQQAFRTRRNDPVRLAKHKGAPRDEQ